MSTQSLFAILEKTVRVLIVDDEPTVLDHFADMLEEHRLLTVRKAGSSREAEGIIREWRPHLCLCDLGIADMEQDEFYLLRKYSKIFPIIVVSGTSDIERAFKASSFGIAGIFAKPMEFFSVRIWQKFRDVFLERCILPVPENSMNPVFRECCRVLQVKIPKNVADWANKVGITDTYLRKMWSDYYSTSPKHVLFLFKLYMDVFNFYNGMYLDGNDTKKSGASLFDLNECYQQVSYYLLHRKAFETIRDKESRNLKLSIAVA